MTDTPADPLAASPAAAGPAGSSFEGKVGAFFLLALAAQTAPLALPGTVAAKVSFQRAREGFPLDDVIVHADQADGTHATLQVQAKRTITFAPQDPVFRDVVAQVAKAIQEPSFWDGCNELAVATPRSTTKTTGAYQDVLKWARDIGSHEEFFARLARHGAANPDMRTFISTFRAHLKEAGAAHDDPTVWRILHRFHVLNLDFESSGSIAETYALAHARMLLPADRTSDAAILWSTLIALSLDKAAAGGDLDLNSLQRELQKKGIQPAHDRAWKPIFDTIQSEARLALADIGVTVGTTRLSRHVHLSAVRDGQESHRFVLIRGDAGVGKSGVLRQLAERAAEDAPVLVLAPSRIASNGLLAHCRRLGFQGTAEDFLTRLAATGNATIFIDNLERFGDDERQTIKDVFRIASRLPGLSVVATARTTFGKTDTWLPEEATAAFGEASVSIAELNEDDLEEIRAAEPHLRSLLADAHPAKAIARNLFRLSRIARQPAGQDIPTTELAMASHWWSTADGPDAGRRERQRVLRQVADAVFQGLGVVDVSDSDATAVDALVGSESLLDRGSDRVALRHDVLRQWALANRIIEDHNLIDSLPLGRPSSPVLARAVELVARAALERGTTAPTWFDLLRKVSEPSHHLSWRRAVLLAIANSEASFELLGQHAAALLADDAKLLIEITRAVRAVNVVPADIALRGRIPEGFVVPKGIFIPYGTSWAHLLSWLIANFDTLPAAALKDVLDFFWDWSVSTAGHNPLTPYILDRVYPLLRQVTVSEDSTISALSSSQRRGIIDVLRNIFTMFCGVRPVLAEDYLSLLAENPDRALEKLASEPGELPRAAPQTFADIFRAALIKSDEDTRQHRSQYDRADPFSYLDHSFFPPSDRTQAFAALLVHAPAVGLALIQDIAAHAITAMSQGASPGDDGIPLVIDDQERFFPWQTTYRWARDEGPNVVSAGLSALRTWALARIQKGDAVSAVMADVLGPAGTCAAFVLVAIDVLRSQETLTLMDTVPFVGSPELLCLDRQRSTLDQGGLRRPVPARASVFAPQNLPSLEQLLPYFAVSEDATPREVLKKQLEDAAQRLGPPDADATFGDPAVMATLALNRINPENWSTNPEDPNQVVYTSPADEAQREQTLSSAAASSNRDFFTHTNLLMAVDHPERSSPAFAQGIAEWIASADAAPSEERDHPDNQDRLRAALVALRDGSEESAAQYRDWALEILSAAATQPRDPYGSVGQRLPYNDAALAFVGLFHAHRRQPSDNLVAKLLHLAATRSFESSIGAHAVSHAIASLDPRLTKALVRTAFVASVKPRPSFSFDEAKDREAQESHARAVEAHVQAELSWLQGDPTEPAWPAFPMEQPRRRRGIRLPPNNAVQEEPTEPEETYVDERTTASWLELLYPLCTGASHGDVAAIAQTYGAYTSNRNGAGLERHVDVDGSMRGGWNEAYYGLLARLARTFTPEHLDEICAAITELPDRAFLDVVPSFFIPFQEHYFADPRLEAALIKARAVFAARLYETRQWQDHIRRSTGGVETHLSSAIPPLLLGYYGYRRTGSLLEPHHIASAAPLLEGVSAIVSAGPTLFIGGLAISLLEVAPVPRLLPFAIEIAEALLNAHPNDAVLWVDYGLGKRWCNWLDALTTAHPSSPSADALIEARINTILGQLTTIGVAEAAALERKLT